MILKVNHRYVIGKKSLLEGQLTLESTLNRDSKIALLMIQMFQI